MVMINKKDGEVRYVTLPIHADGAADTFAGRSSALPVILRRWQSYEFFLQVVIQVKII